MRKFLFVYNLKKSIFVRFFSLNLSSKSPWRSAVKIKKKHRKKNCRKLVFWVFQEQVLSNIIFERLHCYDVTLVKEYNKPLLQKSETKIFDQIRFHKKLIQSQCGENSGVFRLKQIMSKLLTKSKCLQ